MRAQESISKSTLYGICCRETIVSGTKRICLTRQCPTISLLYPTSLTWFQGHVIMRPSFCLVTFSFVKLILAQSGLLITPSCHGYKQAQIITTLASADLPGRRNLLLTRYYYSNNPHPHLCIFFRFCYISLYHKHTTVRVALAQEMVLHSYILGNIFTIYLRSYLVVLISALPSVV